MTLTRSHLVQPVHDIQSMPAKYRAQRQYTVVTQNDRINPMPVSSSRLRSHSTILTTS